MAYWEIPVEEADWLTDEGAGVAGMPGLERQEGEGDLDVPPAGYDDRADRDDHDDQNPY